MVQNMGESAISVAIRTRPLLGDEAFPSNPISFHDGVMVETLNKTFTFDFVFPPNTKNQTVYDLAVANKIPNIFEGYNVTILAYGSTGSGKTYTMGTDYSPKTISNLDMGIIPLGLNEIFRVLQSEKDVKNFCVKVSFIEIYQEAIYDLCHPNAKNFQKQDPKFMDKNGPKIQEEKDGSFKVTNLTETRVNSIEEALDILVKGSSVRHTSPTAKNVKSSRSHAIFTVYIEQQDRITLDSKKAKFQLVDLAGSERMASSKTHGISAKEGTNINISLFCLSKVIIALSENRSHIPYRESKLTRILQDSLGGNSHTVMIACVNPSSTSVEETLSTLRYADNTRNIKNKPKINIDPPAVQIQKLKILVEQLTSQLYAAQPLSHLNSDGNLNADGKALELLKSAYSDINDLNLKLSKVEEINGMRSEHLKAIYETIKSIVADLTPIAAVDMRLKMYLEKLEDIQSQCYHLAVNDNINTLIEESSETVEDYESSDAVLRMELDVENNEEVVIEETLESTDDIVTPLKNCDEALIEEIEGIAEKQKDSAKRIKDIDIRIGLANNIVECLNINFESVSEEEQVDSLVKKIQCLSKEKSTLEKAMKIDKKFIVENEEKIGKYETDIKNLQNELVLAKKSLQAKDENKVKVLRLQKEISDLRKLKVKLINKAKDCVNASTILQKKKNLAIRKLTREKNKADIELSKAKTKFSNQVRVLESKHKQALASKQALAQALQKKTPKPSRNVVKSKQSQITLEEWIDEEIKIKVFKTNATADVENYVKNANTLKEDIKKIEQLSPSEENKIELDDMKQLLQIQQNHIKALKKLPADEEQSSNTYPGLDEISDLSEAKLLIQYLFNKCIGTEVEKANQIQDSKVELEKQAADSKELSTKVKCLEEKIEKMAWDHQQKTAQLLLEHEAELLQGTNDLNRFKRASLPKTEADSRKRTLQATTTEKEFKRESMLAEFLESEEDESFTNDPNDPDWRLTPAHKQAKRHRLESKTATDSTVASNEDSDFTKPMDTTQKESASTSQTRPIMPCKCEEGCKSKRCRCQRSKVSCSGACSCRAEKCFNIIDPSA